ncbi:AzlC family ABC transporter permease [Nocardia sp. NPDC003345]
MRSLWRTTDGETRATIALLCAAVGVIGVSYGATATAAGFPAWLPLTLGLLVLAAGSEMLFLGVLAAGGSVTAALAAGLLVNARHLTYGLSIPGVLGTGWQTAGRAHLLNDETVALALAQPSARRGRAAYTFCGLGILLAWPLGTLAGARLGTLLPDPAAFGLDAVFPAVLLALVLPALRDPRVRWPALTGAALALVTTPLLPSGVPLLLAVAGLAAAIPRRDRR